MRTKVLRAICGLAVLLLGAGAALQVAAQAQSSQPERWLHVRVEDKGERAETVRVNLPLSFAEKVIPAIKDSHIRDGKIRIHHHDFDNVDVRAILQAVKETRDGEFVTVQSTHENVRVAKSGGYLLVSVEDLNHKGGKSKADIKVPMTVVDALLSGDSDELNLVAAIRALAAHGDAVLVQVEEQNQTVRVWVDSKNTTE